MDMHEKLTNIYLRDYAKVFVYYHMFNNGASLVGIAHRVCLN